MKIAVAGTGYVGLVTGVALANIGHSVICVDVDESKISMLSNGVSPIFEDGLEDLMKKNKDRIVYTTDYKMAYKNAEVIFVGVGTPERHDGSANLDYVQKVCEQIAEYVENDCVVVIKSTVPIGTNDKLEEYLNNNKKLGVRISVASNPEFLAQGTAIKDTLHASRIVVGTEDKRANIVMREIYKTLTAEPYNVPYLSMNRRSAEMVKYASNDFLALKISYINEVANLCETIGANIDDVTNGMGFDGRIGSKFLNAGIGYGGSCFPKDTKALHWFSRENNAELKTVKSTIEVNAKQKLRLFDKLKKDCENIAGLKVAILGASFKPGTDDLREAPSIDIINALSDYDLDIVVYDPVSIAKLKDIFGDRIKYSKSISKALSGSDVCIITTEWPQIVNYKLNDYKKYMNTPNIYDGRNCYSIDEAKKAKIYYNSIGRPAIGSYLK